MTSTHTTAPPSPRAPLTSPRVAAKAAVTLGLAAALGLVSCSSEAAPSAPSPATTTNAPALPRTVPGVEPTAAGGGAAAAAVLAVQHLLEQESGPAPHDSPDD
ncbi:hypothetical protein [Sanguibacter antarcticus]|nr:hypothetical protein [Sanguibacter antarcticus]